MTGFWVVVGVLAYAALLVLLARVLDKARAAGDKDIWAGWYKGKTSDRTQSGGLKGSEYDTMNDHGNNEVDGGL
jgi:hypothetical protein